MNAAKKKLVDLDELVALGEVTVSYHIKKRSGFFVKSSKDLFELVRKLYSDGRINYEESTYAVLFSRSNEYIGHVKTGQGNATGCVVNINKIFNAAIRTNASGVILAHNHPSGNLTASRSDISITEKVRDGLKFIDVALLDHCILSDATYLSMADEGIIKF